MKINFKTIQTGHDCNITSQTCVALSQFVPRVQIKQLTI